jgi:hypothetical protein
MPGWKCRTLNVEQSTAYPLIWQASPFNVILRPLAWPASEGSCQNIRHMKPLLLPLLRPLRLPRLRELQHWELLLLLLRRWWLMQKQVLLPSFMEVSPQQL